MTNRLDHAICTINSRVGQALKMASSPLAKCAWDAFYKAIVGKVGNVAPQFNDRGGTGRLLNLEDEGKLAIWGLFSPRLPHFFFTMQDRVLVPE